MPKDINLEGPELRQAEAQGRWFTRWGHTGPAFDYGHDVGYMHRGDYAWHQAELDAMIFGTGAVSFSSDGYKYIPLKSIGRYLDGEDEERYGAS